MFNMRNRKTQRIVCGIIVLLLVIVMVVPMVLGFESIPDICLVKGIRIVLKYVTCRVPYFFCKYNCAEFEEKSL